MSNDFAKEIEPYESLDEEMPPPCHGELMVPLFDIYKEGKVLSNGRFLMPVDLIRESYPEISESDLGQIMEYLQSTEEFCTDVCCSLARCCLTPYVPKTEDTKQKKTRIIRVCQKRYPWMEEEQVEDILDSVCWLSNR